MPNSHFKNLPAVLTSVRSNVQKLAELAMIRERTPWDERADVYRLIQATFDDASRYPNEAAWLKTIIKIADFTGVDPAEIDPAFSGSAEPNSTITTSCIANTVAELLLRECREESFNLPGFPEITIERSLTTDQTQFICTQFTIFLSFSAAYSTFVLSSQHAEALTLARRSNLPINAQTYPDIVSMIKNAAINLERGYQEELDYRFQC
jgi:hypothetical protein